MFGKIWVKVKFNRGRKQSSPCGVKKSKFQPPDATIHYFNITVLILIETPPTFENDIRYFSFNKKMLFDQILKNINLIMASLENISST